MVQLMAKLKLAYWYDNSQTHRSKKYCCRSQGALATWVPLSSDKLRFKSRIHVRGSWSAAEHVQNWNAFATTLVGRMQWHCYIHSVFELHSMSTRHERCRTAGVPNMELLERCVKSAPVQSALSIVRQAHGSSVSRMSSRQNAASRAQSSTSRT